MKKKGNKKVPIPSSQEKQAVITVPVSAVPVTMEYAGVRGTPL